MDFESKKVLIERCRAANRHAPIGQRGRRAKQRLFQECVGYRRKACPVAQYAARIRQLRQDRAREHEEDRRKDLDDSFAVTDATSQQHLKLPEAP